MACPCLSKFRITVCPLPRRASSVSKENSFFLLSPSSTYATHFFLVGAGVPVLKHRPFALVAPLALLFLFLSILSLLSQLQACKIGSASGRTQGEWCQ